MPRTENGKLIAHFDPAKHLYTRNGKRVPSVTTIASYAAAPDALMYWNVTKAAQCAVDGDDWLLMDHDEAVRFIAGAGNRERDLAGTRGTAMHDAAEWYLRHGELPKGLDEEQRALAEQCARFVTDFGFTAEWIENAVFNDTHSYAGKFDAVGTCTERPELGHLMIDWKSGAMVVPKFATQLAAYVHAELLLTDDGDLIDMPAVDTAAVVQVTTENYTVHPLACGHDEFVAFCSALDVYRWNLRCGRKTDTPLGSPLNVMEVAS